MIIAIDGPAASGKGTLGKRLAAHFGLRHLDTGLIYRAVAKALLDAGERLDDVPSAEAAAEALDPETFDETVLKSHAIGEAASVVSAIPEVRAALLGLPARLRARAARRGARRPRHRHGHLPGCRREDLRHRNPGGARPPAGAGARAGGEVDEADVLADIRRRDERDSKRAAAPLKPAPDAHLLDTTHLDIDAAFRAAVDIVEAVRAGRSRG